MSLPDYYTRPREDILPYIPAGTNRVLDVGCGAGFFGETMLRTGAAQEVWGIEYVPEMAEAARSRLNRVETGDAMQILSTMPHGHFDVISFTDVLEHLAWPDEALKLAKPLLAPGGVVVASLPNVRYFNALWEIVWLGEFRYQDEGIFDRTHLRFFTQKTIPEWFERGGFHVRTLVGINPNPGRKFNLLNRLLLRKLEDCRWLQFAIVADPKP
jgi:2-polyprenyl-3-methyl-5-hydroxy-6-metoxy-1,4-benzoquinol methylase